MADDLSWAGLKEGWERLRWARAQKFETAQDAAVSMGMRPNTYTGYERRPDSSKSTRLNDQAAIRFGKKFGVRWEWLLIGDGQPYSKERQPDEDPDPNTPIRRATSAMRLVPRDQQEAIANAIEALVKTGTRDQ